MEELEDTIKDCMQGPKLAPDEQEAAPEPMEEDKASKKRGGDEANKASAEGDGGSIVRQAFSCLADPKAYLQQLPEHKAKEIIEVAGDDPVQQKLLLENMMNDCLKQMPLLAQIRALSNEPKDQVPAIVQFMMTLEKNSESN